ncbi:MBL fold metallo-hydrolase RNA specificity domain-containing protein [Pontiella sulfatireligans]|uniref:Ribonuclease n=1 Tax=Pontiella sulfatireligans TaxID=2750658 RepID=A0A6C2UIA4_9BACT|nr:MBL fold metallo-hydrolase [Pontiella sulfatireligans]VGO19858.1 Ribonuclease [Pontiella sulfatireligans]
MDIKLKFFGAAKNVTGSCFFLEANGVRLLVDCGLYQERDLKPRNFADFPVPANTIDAVLLTHAHLDHCGRLPKLVKEGFKGTIFATAATAEIANIIMLDSAHIQEEDIKHKMKRHERSGKKSPFPYEPLYTTEDAEKTNTFFNKVRYDTKIEIGSGITAEFRDAGHVFGSSMIRVAVEQGGETRTILFSGDVGRWDLPIMRDPSQFEQADYVLIESTYGDRVHGEVANIPGELERIINETVEAGGNVVIPSFALERTQELLYHLNGLLKEDRIPHLLAFVDSPMAIKVTEVFKKHPELFDEEALAQFNAGEQPCDFPGLTMSRTVDQSKSIGHIKGTAIIIAGSGMCTGGRVKHHLKSNISRPESTILFVGYQAFGTLGRRILEKPETVRIFGEEYPVRARIERISGFSAHADQNELYQWISSLKTPPRKVFVVHGEESQAMAFQKFLTEKTGWSCTVPEYEQEVHLT